jgi:hypothetical protein
MLADIVLCPSVQPTALEKQRKLKVRPWGIKEHAIDHSRDRAIRYKTETNDRNKCPGAPPQRAEEQMKTTQKCVLIDV